MSSRVILASASIGRRMLFEQALRSFLIEPAHIDEDAFCAENTRDLPRILAEEKAKKVSRQYPHDYVLAFDTLVFCDGSVVGKPADKNEAKTMLRFLSGKRQSVISGYAFCHGGRGVFESGADETVLSFAHLEDDFIETYVQTHPVTKFAGGYAIQNNDQFITIEQGAFDVIVGAPMERVVSFLVRNNLSTLLLPERSLPDLSRLETG